MGKIRAAIEDARGAYRASRYPGDLASQLLPLPRGLGWQRWGLFAAAAAIAAVMAVVFWPHHHQPDKRQLVVQTDGPMGLPVSPVKLPSLHDLGRIEYSQYVSHVRDGVGEAMSQLGSGVDAALDAPLVTDSVQTVKQVAGEIEELAVVTWSQLKPRTPGC